MTAITSSPPLGADPLGCHICIYNKRNPTKRNKTNAYASARLSKSHNRSVTYEQSHRGFRSRGNCTSTWVVTGGGKNLCLVLATVPNSRVGSGSGSDPEPNRCNGSYHTKTRTVAIGPVLPPKTRHFNITTLASIKYLSSDRIMTWSVCRLCSSSRSFTSRFQICVPTNIRWVAIENPLISRKMGLYFTATQRITVGSQIWKREVKERLEMHNLRTDHLLIWSELKYLIGAKVVRTVKMELRSGYNPAKNRGFMSGPGNNPAKTARFGFLGGS